MAKKRKHDPKVVEPTEPPQKQQQQQQQQQEEVEDVQNQQKQKEVIVEERVEETEEYEQVEEEEEVEEEVEEEDEEEEDDGDEEQQDPNSTQNLISITAASDLAANEDDDEDPIDQLLEPFGKDQLINLLREAADSHRDVAERIRRIADEDPAHRKIFVHGLGWDTNAETLISAFKPYGEIEDCKAVSDKVSGKSKGYGFILFKRRSGARKALKEPQKKIGNRMTACQLASIGPVPVAPSVSTPIQQQVSEYTQRKIYVSNVGSDLDPQDLTNFFAKYGEIEEGPLGLDKHSGKPKGFCLYVYRHVEGARRALEEPHKNFEGHILHCQKAIDGPKPGKSQQQQHHHHHNVQKPHFQRNNNPSYGGSSSGPAHLMAPAAGPGMGFNQGAAAAPALNPALGQALTALLATQGAGLGLTNLLGSLGSAATPSGVPGAAPGMQSAYGNQANISPSVIGSYGSQGMMQGGYSNQQVGQGGSGRGQHGVGQYTPYMGH
ncbi:UBP1-associated protein 2A-like [Euphorbia lathyris]|uniref:UBP1-associated protein 2A-like n=1 Tax=Euphorbia lathyris TaxID=212925 RepID=UPI0033134725